jgi:hypothetical protein
MNRSYESLVNIKKLTAYNRTLTKIINCLFNPSFALSDNSQTYSRSHLQHPSRYEILTSSYIWTSHSVLFRVGIEVARYCLMEPRVDGTGLFLVLKLLTHGVLSSFLPYSFLSFTFTFSTPQKPLRLQVQFPSSHFIIFPLFRFKLNENDLWMRKRKQVISCDVTFWRTGRHCGMCVKSNRPMGRSEGVLTTVFWEGGWRI